MMMWREQRLSFSILPRFSPQLVSREYESSLFCLKKSTKRVQKSREMPVTIRTSLRALIYTLLKRKEAFSKCALKVSQHNDLESESSNKCSAIMSFKCRCNTE